MRFFDLHCDTMTECYQRNKSLNTNDLQISIQKAKYISSYAQCFAAWIPDNLRGEDAFFRFLHIAERLRREIQENREKIELCRTYEQMDDALNDCKVSAILTVENASALGGKLENLAIMQGMGVKMITLTWNGENEIGTGVGSGEDKGITDFGKKVVSEMEMRDIAVDISHASERLFYDVINMATRPVVASHSNAKKICASKRNLTDEQIKIIVEMGGLIGLNLYKAFLNDNPDLAGIIDILKHTDYILSAGGENSLAFGCDMDGADMPCGISGISSMGELYEIFLRHNYKESLVKKIFFDNAHLFFVKNKFV